MLIVFTPLSSRVFVRSLITTSQVPSAVLVVLAMRGVRVDVGVVVGVGDAVGVAVGFSTSPAVGAVVGVTSTGNGGAAFNAAVNTPAITGVPVVARFTFTVMCQVMLSIFTALAVMVVGSFSGMKSPAAGIHSPVVRANNCSLVPLNKFRSNRD